jgi:outer membrane receptor protein involved in Fe transport
MDLFANLRTRWIWWNMDPDTASLFNPHDKKWVVDFRISKGFKLTEGTRLAVFLDVFNLTNQVYWDRNDSPNPRRWAQLGVEVNFK